MYRVLDLGMEGQQEMYRVLDLGMEGQPEDTVTVPPTLCSQYERPDKAVAIATKYSRFK
jgi:hypothetical protein